MDSKVSFKKSNRKQFRRRHSSSGSEPENEITEDFRGKLEETKEIQKLRKRPHGVSAGSLAEGKKILPDTSKNNSDDPYKLKLGGILDLKTLKKQKMANKDPELDAVDLGNTFSAETNARDEDADMVKYIEEELAKRKGITKVETAQELEKNGSMKDDVLYHVSEHLRSSSVKKSEEMLSNQMLSGIPEVDLGIEAKIKNIEATEEAKNKMIQDRLNSKESSMSFVPTNMAVNFVQHNRYNLDVSDQSKNKKPRKEIEIKPEAVAVVGEDSDPVIKAVPIVGAKKQTNPKSDKATDDFYFEKFKKQHRRH